MARSDDADDAPGGGARRRDAGRDAPRGRAPGRGAPRRGAPGRGAPKRRSDEPDERSDGVKLPRRNPGPGGTERRAGPRSASAAGKGDPSGRGPGGRSGRSRDARSSDPPRTGAKPSSPKRAARPPRSRTGFGPHGAPRTERRAAESAPQDTPAPSPRKPAPLRVVGTRRGPKPPAKGPGPRADAPPARRRLRRAAPDIETEVLRVGGRRGSYLLGQLMQAAEAFAGDRDREALRILRPVRDAVPDAPSVRELTGLAEYRVGNYRAAAKELQAFVGLTDSAEQHPVLMDCYRAQRRWKRVDDLWAELGVSSPSAELVTEGRIVVAGSLADRGRLDEALTMLRRKGKPVARPRSHHLRLWYALADLEERAGNLATARDVFARVRRADPEFADVSARLAALR